MIKININELRKYKIICESYEYIEYQYDDNGIDCIGRDGESYTTLGFIDNIYVKDGKLNIDVYSVNSYGNRDTTISIDINKINLYKKLIGRKKYKWENPEWNYEMDPNEIEIDVDWDDIYEVMKINTEKEYEDYERDENWCYTDKKISDGIEKQEIKLYKDTGFEFIIDLFSYYSCAYEVPFITNILLTDEKISKILTVDYYYNI